MRYRYDPVYPAAPSWLAGGLFFSSPGGAAGKQAEARGRSTEAAARSSCTGEGLRLKAGNIAATRNDNAHGFIAALFGIEIVQPLTKNACVVAHNVVVARVVRCRTAQNMGPNLLFCNFGVATLKLFLADIAKKV